MKYTMTVLDSVVISEIVNSVSNAEACRDIEGAIKSFKPIWADIDQEPDFSQYSPLQQAELYRLSGYFLSYCGKARNLPSYQERGKNLLTKAVFLFSDLNQIEKASETEVILALCYFYEGAILESELILEETSQRFEKDQLSEVYLKSRINQLLVMFARRKYQEAILIIDEIKPLIDFCRDKRLCSVFHEKAGLIYRGTNQISKVVSHYSEAIRFAEETNNLLFISSIKNNLSFLYTKIGELDLAHYYANEAIKIAKEDNQTGWLPHYFDTKAAIYFDEGNFNAALETINEAIGIFQKGDDAGGLTEALWNKCKFLLYLNRKEEAIKLFAELAPIANERMGEFAVDNISKEFADLIHVKKGGSLIEETQRFRRVEIISAIRKMKYELPSAAEMLKISLDDLTKIIDQEFPELYEEINIERFTAINSNLTNQEQIVRRKISQLYISIPLTNLSENVSTFYLSEELMQEIFGISQDVVLAFEKIDEISANEFILVQNKLNGVHSFGKVQFDEIIDLYFLTDQEEPFAFTLDEVELIGKAVAYLPFSEIDNEKIEFKKFDF